MNQIVRFLTLSVVIDIVSKKFKRILNAINLSRYFQKIIVSNTKASDLQANVTSLRMDIYTIQACFPITRYLKFMHKTLFSSIMEKNVKNDSRDS